MFQTKTTNTGYIRYYKYWLYIVAYYCEGCSPVPLIKYKNNEIEQEKEKYYFWNDSNERLYIDMRRSKGYTDELEKLTRDDGDVTLTIKLKKAAEKKWDWGLLPIHRLNIRILTQIRVI